MATIALKITHTAPSGSSTTRKLIVPRTPAPAFASLTDTVQTRFQLSEQLAFTFRDEDGDLITLSSDDELAELFHSLDDSTTTLRFQLVTLPQRAATFVFSSRPSTTSGTATSISTSSPSPTPPSVVDESNVPAHVQVANAVAGLSDERLAEGLDKRARKDDDEWMRISHRDIKEKRIIPEEEVGDDVEEPTTPTLLFEDPDDDPLPSTAELAQARIEREFPPAASSSSPSTSAPIDSTVPGGFPDDPSEAPLPPSPPSVPFGTLPTSFTSLLSSLPLHAESLSTRLSSTLSSPDSPTHRISSFLSCPPSSLDDLPALARALPSLGAELGGVVREVMDGVKREADEIRGEFARFRGEVEREKSRFDDEIRKAMEVAARTGGEPATRARTAMETESESSVPSAADEEAKEPAADQKQDEEAKEPAAGEKQDEEPKGPAATMDHAAVEALKEVKAEKRAAREARRIEKEHHRQEKESRREHREEVKQARMEKQKEQDQAAEVAEQNSSSSVKQSLAPTVQMPMPGALRSSSPTYSPPTWFDTLAAARQAMEEEQKKQKQAQVAPQNSSSSVKQPLAASVQVSMPGALRSSSPTYSPPTSPVAPVAPAPVRQARKEEQKEQKQAEVASQTTSSLKPSMQKTARPGGLPFSSTTPRPPPRPVAPAADDVRFDFHTFAAHAQTRGIFASTPSQQQQLYEIWVACGGKGLDRMVAVALARMPRSDIDFETFTTRARERDIIVHTLSQQRRLYEIWVAFGGRGLDRMLAVARDNMGRGYAGY
ncbi:hypothetical protein JCM5296_002350 [Sporobolomyces johnsonii]